MAHPVPEPNRRTEQPRAADPDSVGRGPGLDPPSEPAEDDADLEHDEAFADREPERSPNDDPAAVQRPPSDS